MSTTPPRFDMPCTFKVSVSEHHPISFPEGAPEGVQDLTRFIYRALLECEGKCISAESPSFSDEERQSVRAMEVLHELVTHITSDSVLGGHQRAHYEMRDGVLHRILNPDLTKSNPET